MHFYCITACSRNVWQFDASCCNALKTPGGADTVENTRNLKTHGSYLARANPDVIGESSVQAAVKHSAIWCHSYIMRCHLHPHSLIHCLTPHVPLHCCANLPQRTELHLTKTLEQRQSKKHLDPRRCCNVVLVNTVQSLLQKEWLLVQGTTSFSQHQSQIRSQCTACLNAVPGILLVDWDHYPLRCPCISGQTWSPVSANYLALPGTPHRTAAYLWWCLPPDLLHLLAPLCIGMSCQRTGIRSISSAQHHLPSESGAFI